MEGSPAPWGYAAFAGDVLEALIPDEVFAAESVLRLAWQRLTLAQGGVLVHGCALRFGASGVVAIGHSGAGKSTLAALASGVPGNAELLTDEIVQLMPDGRVFGTPFRSNHENVSAPGPATLRTLLLLAKGQEERLDPVSPAEVASELFSQLFWLEHHGFPPVAEGRKRLLATIGAVGVQRLTFRKHADVGPFLRSVFAQ